MNVDFPDMGGGIIQDLPPEQLKRNEWSGGNNARFVRAQVTKIAGHTEVFGTTSASGTIGTLALGNAIWLHNIIDDLAQPWWIYCDTDAIYATDGTTHYDIGGSATASASTTGGFAATLDYGWNGGNFNGLAIINSHDRLPRYWSPSGSNGTRELTVSAVFTACRVMRPYKTFLMAIGVDEGSGFNDNLVLWPTAADVGGLPPSWDYTDTTEDAGRVELDDGYGILLDGARLRDDFFVYAEHAIYRFSPLPTSDIFSIRRQFSEVGALTRNCIATVRASHAFMGDGDIYVHDGQSIQSIVTKRWKRWVFDQIGSNWSRSYVVPNYAYNEVWFCFPTGTSEFPNKALIWNFDDNTFSSRDLVDSSKGGAAFIAKGRMPESGDDTFDGGPSLTFDQETDLVFDTTSTEINQRDLVMLQKAESRKFDKLNGTATALVVNWLVDADKLWFKEKEVQVGDVVINKTQSTTATVSAVIASNSLALTADIFPGAGTLDDYEVQATVDVAKSSFYRLDNGLTYDNESYLFYVEKDCLPLGRNGAFSQYDEYQVTAIRPRVRSALGGNMKVKIGMRDSVGDGRVWVDSATFAIGVDDKVDVRATGTVCTVRFECTEDIDLELNGFGIDFDVVGSRPR